MSSAHWAPDYPTSIREGRETRHRSNLSSFDVRIGSKADIRTAKTHVRFTPESGHWMRFLGRPLWANSGSELYRLARIERKQHA